VHRQARASQDLRGEPDEVEVQRLHRVAEVPPVGVDSVRVDHLEPLRLEELDAAQPLLRHVVVQSPRDLVPPVVQSEQIPGERQQDHHGVQEMFATHVHPGLPENP